MKTEKELLLLLKQGDEQAIRALFDEFYDRLCLYAASYVRNYQVAEEIVEDIFIYLWIKASRIDINTSLKNYLYRSVYNNCIRFINREGKAVKVPIEEEVLKNMDYLNASHYPDPESDLILQELERKAEMIMESLPKQCKEIYFLSRFENMSYSKIAEKLKISAGTVKTQMSRAFQKFREEFGEFLPLLIILSFLELFR